MSEASKTPEEELLEFINATPLVLSLLYDLDLMPEQAKEGSRERSDMLLVASHFKEALDRAQRAEDDQAIANAACKDAIADNDFMIRQSTEQRAKIAEQSSKIAELEERDRDGTKMLEGEHDARVQAETERQAYWTVLELLCERFPQCQAIGDLPGWVDEQSSKIAELEKACKAAFDHVSELRDAWQRGCLSEHDGYGGTRSNRNVDVYVLLRKALASSGQGLLNNPRDRQTQHNSPAGDRPHSAEGPFRS